MRFVKRSEITNFVYHSAVSYKPPAMLNYFWNYGVLALLCLVTQILTGIFLAMHYIADANLAFASVEHIMRDVNYGWLIRYLHSNGASTFFLVVYVHIFRGLYYGSYIYPRQWLWCSGVVILLVMIITAFLGYVLPWGQMSFWAATVITNLASAIPYIGNSIVSWLWGGFAVAAPTLSRFYSLHFLLPFILVFIAIGHILLLHESRSSSPAGFHLPDFLPFTPFYTAKDHLGSIIFFTLVSSFLHYAPDFLGHTDNSIPANPMVTPTHIVPEWYFLPFYAILRSVPDKLGGVVLLLLSILILLALPFYLTYRMRSATYRPAYKYGFWFFFVDCLILGWIGGQNIEPPYYLIGQIATAYYFFHFLIVLPAILMLEHFAWRKFQKHQRILKS